MLKSIKNWIEVRIGLDDLISTRFKNYLVPKDAGIFSTLGLVALVAFLVQVISGILLIMYYTPHPDHAFRSVQLIMNKVPYGWLFRELHVVGANLLVLLLFLHLTNVFYMGRYKKPRDITWLTGGIALFIILGFCITGHLLPWNQMSYWSTTVITSFPSFIPGIGDNIAVFLRGGDYVSGVTLSRFFAFHVALLPTCIVVFIIAHILLVRRMGFAPANDDYITKKEFSYELHTKGMPLYPNFFSKQLFMTTLFFAVVFFIITFMPETFLPSAANIEANPLSTPEFIKPPFYFLPAYQILRFVPNEFLGISLVLIFCLLFLFWPFLDTGRERNILKRPILLTIFFTTIILWVVLTIMGGY